MRDEREAHERRTCKTRMTEPNISASPEHSKKKNHERRKLTKKRTSELELNLH